MGAYLKTKKYNNLNQHLQYQTIYWLIRQLFLILIVCTISSGTKLSGYNTSMQAITECI